ncbi:hypothetical protein [Streptomyces europaeiscabiei]|uniref:hypothetical protein n=1 Tax=Streptomyces europaeiscabiei TaxID=146819 RepID=UPI002E171383
MLAPVPSCANESSTNFVDEVYADDNTHSEESSRVNTKRKAIILIALAALTMATLIYVNLQNVRGTGSRGISLVGDGRTPEAGQLSSNPNRTARMES